MSEVCKFDMGQQVVIVTGGAGLLGREYASALAESGAHVVVADINGEQAEMVADDLCNRFTDQRRGKALGIEVDVTQEKSVAGLVERTLDRFGRVDGLVNNAAIDPKFDNQHAGGHTQGFEDYPLELWNESLAVNLTGMFLCAKAVAPVMLSRERGAIVNISSVYGMVGPDQRLYEDDEKQSPKSFKPVTYSVTKSAVIGFTKYLATYWAGRGIRVNTLTLGGVFNEHDSGFVRRYSERTPLRRMARKSEYCEALLFLLSEASSYMTGSNMVVDGGWTAW